MCIVDRTKCFTVFKNILDEIKIINYLRGCRGRVKYFFRTLISKQHTDACETSTVGITSYIRYIVQLMSVCLLLSQINHLVSLYWFWSIKNTKGRIFHLTPMCVEASLQTHSESRIFFSLQLSSGICVLKNFGMIQLIFEVYSEEESLILSRMYFERKILPHFSLLLWHCAHQLCNSVRYFSVCQTFNLMSYTWNKPELMEQSVSLWHSQNWLVEI